MPSPIPNPLSPLRMRLVYVLAKAKDGMIANEVFEAVPQRQYLSSVFNDLETLREAGYVRLKVFDVGRFVRREYRLTTKGRRAYLEHRKASRCMDRAALASFTTFFEGLESSKGLK